MAAIIAGMAVLGAAATAAARAARDMETGHMGAGFATDPIMDELMSKMDAHEDVEFRKLSATVAGLYIHWFFSLLAFVECLLRLIIYGIVIFLWSLFIYLSCCLSCGKTINAPSEPVMMAAVARYSIYSAFICALISNLLCPFAPVLYFWKRRVVLVRPPGMTRHKPLCHEDHACCTCNEFGNGMFLANGIDVPVWKMAEIYLSTVAVLHILGGGCNAWSSLCEFKCWMATERYLSWAVSDIMQDMAADTAIFYDKQYNVTSFEAFLGARYGGLGTGGVGGEGGGGVIQGRGPHQNMTSMYVNQSSSGPQAGQREMPVVYVDANNGYQGQRGGIPIVIATPLP